MLREEEKGSNKVIVYRNTNMKQYDNLNGNSYKTIRWLNLIFEFMNTKPFYEFSFHDLL
jgi:hypothetical protein